MRWWWQLYHRFFSRHKQSAQKLKSLTGFAPVQIHLYQTAFTHSSSSSEVVENNERLELLGDAVYDLVVSEYLFNKYPFKTEGFLSEMRSKIVSRREITRVAKRMGLHEYLESTLSKRNLEKSSTLGNALEALIGAVYFDQGYKRTKRFIEQKILTVHYDLDTLESTVVNFKSMILHHAQKNGLELDFRMLEEIPGKNGKRFRMALVLGGNITAESTSRKKKTAEQEAARKTLEGLGLL